MPAARSACLVQTEPAVDCSSVVCDVPDSLSARPPGDISRVTSFGPQTATMKTTVGKVLSVATAVASVIFLGFVLAAIFGGPNWKAEAQTIPGFSIARGDAEPFDWIAARHVGEGAIAPNKAIEPVLMSVYDAKIKTVNDQAAKLEEKDGPLQTKINDAMASIKMDEEALKNQLTELEALLKQTEGEVVDTSQQVEAKAEAVRKVELQIQSRREDVLRLLAQVEQLRSDRFRIGEIQQQLQDLIQQIDGSLERAESRRDQLTSK